VPHAHDYRLLVGARSSSASELRAADDECVGSSSVRATTVRRVRCEKDLRAERLQPEICCRHLTVDASDVWVNGAPGLADQRPSQPLLEKKKGPATSETVRREEEGGSRMRGEGR